MQIQNQVMAKMPNLLLIQLASMEPAACGQQQSNQLEAITKGIMANLLTHCQWAQSIPNPSRQQQPKILQSKQSELIQLNRVVSLAVTSLLQRQTSLA